MEHQSINRGEPIPKDAQEFLTTQPEPVVLRMASQAIDAVRCAGWWNYDNTPEQ